MKGVFFTDTTGVKKIVFINAIIMFIWHHVIDGYNNDKNSGPLKPKVREADGSFPEATEGKVSNRELCNRNNRLRAVHITA